MTRPSRKPKSRRVPIRTGRRDWLWGVALGAVALAVVLAALVALRPSGVKTFETVAGVDCESGERLEYHIHSYLAILVEGQQVPVPANIGITERCLFWLHTHDVSGIIHVEAPEQKDFTLGQFFAVWGQPLTPSQVLDHVADATHNLQLTVDGRVYSGDPAAIVLKDKESIVIQFGPPFGQAPQSPLTPQ